MYRGDFTFKLRVLRYLLAGAYEEWRTSVWQRDLDSSYCCDGRECCCAAESIREMWSWNITTPQPLRKRILKHLLHLAMYLAGKLGLRGIILKKGKDDE